MNPNTPIHVMIVEDHPSTAKGLKVILETTQRAIFHVDACVNTFNAAATLLPQIGHKIHIIILDINLPDDKELRLLSLVKANYPHIKTVVFSVHTSLKKVAESVEKGAVGYLNKAVSGKRIVQTLCQVMEHTESAILCLEGIGNPNDTPDEPLDDTYSIPTLTEEELAIIKGVLEEKTNVQIEAELTGKAENQGFKVANLLAKSIFHKARVKGRAGLVVFALKNRLFPDFEIKLPKITNPSINVPNQTRIMIVEDHEATLKGLKKDLHQVQQIEVVATAKDGIEAEEMLDKLAGQVQVVLTDYRMPRKDGLELIKSVRQKFPTVKFIILSVEDVLVNALKAIESGAVKYLVKNSSTKEIIECIHQITKQSGVVRNYFLSNGLYLEQEDFKILSWLAEDFSAKEIAGKLSSKETTVSQSQVENAIKRLRRDFDAASVEGLVKIIYRLILSH